MVVAGCDVGSLTAKVVIMDDGKMIGQSVVRGGNSPGKSAEKALNLAMESAGIEFPAISCVVGTGYGKEQIAFANRTESEIVCHARGAWWNHPATRMVIDIGGQDSKVIRLDEKGGVTRYIYNDKCASGTGRFLEIMADALDLQLETMGEAGNRFTETLRISNQCVIFAETEVVSLVNEGKEIADIVNALHHAMANRVAALAKSIGLEQDIVMTGGVAKNCGVFNALSAGLNLPVTALTKIDPQVNGALGAALLAEDQLKHTQSTE